MNSLCDKWSSPGSNELQLHFCIFWFHFYTGPSSARKLPREYVCRQHFADTNFTLAGKRKSSKSLYSNLTLPFSLTSWRTHREFLILWRRPSFPDPYKKIFQDPYLTNQGAYLNPGRHFLTCSDIPWPVINSRNQHFFKRRHLVSSWALQMKVLVVEKSEASACGGEIRSIDLHSSSPKREAWESVIEEHGLDRVAKLTPKKKKLYYRIQTRDSMVSRFRNRYMTV